MEWVNFASYRNRKEASRILYHRDVTGFFYSSPRAVLLAPAWLRGFARQRFSVVNFTRAGPQSCCFGEFAMVPLILNPAVLLSKNRKIYWEELAAT